MKRMNSVMNDFSRENSQFYLFNAEIEGMISVLNSRKNGRVSRDHLWIFFIEENQLTLKELCLFNILMNSTQPVYMCSIESKERTNQMADVGKNLTPLRNVGFNPGMLAGNLSYLKAVHYFKNMGSRKDYRIDSYLGCLMDNAQNEEKKLFYTDSTNSASFDKVLDK
jgi:hypothetical protein